MSIELQEIIDAELEESKVESIKNIMEKLGFSVEKAMETLEVPEHEYEKYKKLVLNPSGMV